MIDPSIAQATAPILDSLFAEPRARYPWSAAGPAAAWGQDGARGAILNALAYLEKVSQRSRHCEQSLAFH
jgi:hypothetical protein